MKYAIISDIHGNMAALSAVLSDAKSQGVDMFLILGDYGTAFPWVNEVAETIRSLDSCLAIRGNHEEYMIELSGQNQSSWVHEQLKGVYWNYLTLTEENREYLMSLPKTAKVSNDGEEIHLAHDFDLIFRVPKIELFQSVSFRELMIKTPFSHEEYLRLGREALLSRSDVISDIAALPKGVYLFGHNHLQFYMEYDGRLFVNPGSCGSPCDFDPRASYTILERLENRWKVFEQRLEYDIAATSEGLLNSNLALEAPVWSSLNEIGLRTGKNYVGAFIEHLMQSGRKFGSTQPLSNSIWDIAVKTWSIDGN